MRYLLANLLILLIMSSGVIAAEQSSSSGIEGFDKWAMSESGKLDQTWCSISRTGNSSGLDSKVNQKLDRRSGIPKYWRTNTTGATTVWPSSRASYTGSSNPSFLPLSTRERRGTSRGNFKLRHPASVRLSAGNSFRRIPFKGITNKNFFNRGKSISRPRLTSTHRGWTSHSYRRSATRPASNHRISRPSRRFRW
jgi:hypothetical protein